jgi:hypothetical protein
LPIEEIKPDSARVAFAQVHEVSLSSSLFAEAFDFSAALSAALVHGTKVTRYGREWRLGRYEAAEPYVQGRIGFERVGPPVELWDEEEGDFTEERPREGKTSAFMLSLATGRVVFQLRSNTIRAQSFTGALQALLNEADTSGARWRVEDEVAQLPWEEWVSRVDRVTSLIVVLDRPNPHYGPRQRVRDVIEGAHAVRAKVAWKAAEEGLEGIDLADEFVKQALEHAQDYGTWRAEGESPDTSVTPNRWDKEHQGAPVTREAEMGPQADEPDPAALRAELSEREGAGGDEPQLPGYSERPTAPREEGGEQDA